MFRRKIAKNSNQLFSQTTSLLGPCVEQFSCNQESVGSSEESEDEYCFLGTSTAARKGEEAMSSVIILYSILKQKHLSRP